LFEVPSVRQGNVIEILPRGATQVVGLEVVEACSGIRSLMTLVTLALILSYFTQEKREKINQGLFGFLTDFDFWRTIILMSSAIPIAILTNASRVTATGVLTYYYGKQAAEGFWHDASGWLVYLVALILLIGVNSALKKIKVKSSNSNIQSEEAISSYAPSIANYQIVALFVILLCGGVFINWFEGRGELQIGRLPLREIPAELGEWRQKGSDTRFSEQTESVLRTTDYVMRDYVLPHKGRAANLYVGYYASQRAGATYHSPQNCLPGAGWEMKSPELVEIKTPNGKTFFANRYIVQNGDYRAVLIYWYQGRGRITANEYADKVYTVLDSLWRQRSDAAMVRVMTTTGVKDEAESLRVALDLSAQLADNLSPYVPD
jgi:exosortase D (VPLPA-CTERM-specific)